MKAIKAVTYELTWRNKLLTAEAKTLGDMIQALHGAADELRAMKRRGVRLSPLPSRRRAATR